MNPTFKRHEEPKGLMRVGATPRGYIIKKDGKKVGDVETSGYNEPWVCRLMVKVTPTAEQPAPFKWVTLKAKFPTRDEMRDYVKDRRPCSSSE